MYFLFLDFRFNNKNNANDLEVDFRPVWHLGGECDTSFLQLIFWGIGSFTGSHASPLFSLSLSLSLWPDILTFYVGFAPVQGIPPAPILAEVGNQGDPCESILGFGVSYLLCILVFVWLVDHLRRRERVVQRDSSKQTSINYLLLSHLLVARSHGRSGNRAADDPSSGGEGA